MKIKKDMARYKDIQKMVKNRYSLRVIGEKYGIGKQRVWQIVHNK